MKLSKEMEAKILATPGVKISQPAKLGEDHEPVKPAKKAELVTPSIVSSGFGIKFAVAITVAVETANEGNHRSWKARNRRAGAAWKAVREAIGPRLGALELFSREIALGGGLRVTFTRLGGRKLDGMANLGSALKGCEDAMAYLLGADDGDPRWHAIARQEPGGLVGVRIEIEVFSS